MNQDHNQYHNQYNQNAPETPSFETEYDQLQSIVDELESGPKSLDESMREFERGTILKNRLVKKLKNIKQTYAKIATSNGTEVPFRRDVNGQDTNNNLSFSDSSNQPNSSSSSASGQSSETAESSSASYGQHNQDYQTNADEPQSQNNNRSEENKQNGIDKDSNGVPSSNNDSASTSGIPHIDPFNNSMN